MQGVLTCDRVVLSKTITLIESSRCDHQDTARAIVDSLMPYTGKAVRLGITGVPGSGKSTFIETLGTFLVENGYSVAVLAVDPSSKRSGGSVMADKTRMEKLSGKEKAFVRPSPSGENMGGVARKTREAMLVCEAAGFDVIIVETVGVGQSETAVASMVDFFLVLIIPGAGDEIQGIKKGILELADAVAVNKADGDNIKNAEKARGDYESALHLLNPPSPTWTPPVLTCSAINMTGINDIWDTVLDHRKKHEASGEIYVRRKQQAVDWMMSIVEQGLKDHFFKDPGVKKMLQKLTRQVEKGRAAPTAAAGELLSFLDQSLRY